MRYELAPLQRGMLFHALSEPVSTMYVERHRLDLYGTVDPDAFRTAWRAVCALHPALRTAFDVRQPERPVQVVAPDVELPLVVADWRRLSEPERSAREAAEQERGFDLSSGPLFRLLLVRVGDHAWRLLWTHHHIILDGWSVGLVLRDVAAAYAGASLPTPPDYRDYVEVTGGLDLGRARAYWTGVLAGFTEPTPLGVTRTVRRAGSDHAAQERISHPLTRELTGRLLRFAGSHQIDVETLLAGAWATVLARYAGRDDVAFGLTSTGRSGPLPGLDRMVGLLINTLPVRVRLDADLSVERWLARLQQEQARTRELEHTPLDRVQAWSEVPAGRRLFDSILVVEDFPVDPLRLRFGDVRVTGWASAQQTNYPLTLLAFPRERLVLEALFDTGLLGPRLVGQLLGHVETVLAGLTSATSLGEVELMRPAESAGLARRGAPRTSFPVEETVAERFVAWARRGPDRIAVSCGDEQISYRMLLARTVRLASRLRELGVAPGVLVGIYLPRGVDLVVAVLAVAHAGGGYVPVDRRHPAVRVRSIVDDAAIAVLVTDLDADGDLGASATVYVDDGHDPAEPLAALDAGAGDVAYVIYTSGSTGAPKGVVVEHRQLTRLFDATREWFGFGPDDVWTLFHSIAFDFSVWELWGALAHGGRLVIVPDELTRDPAAFQRLLLAEGVTVLNQTPSAFRGLLHAGGATPGRLRLVILGGERLDVNDLRPWLDRHGDAAPRLVNMYGITETTVHVTYRPIVRADLVSGVPSPIGEPIGDLAVRLLDPSGRPVPVGVPGEIHVGGAGVARGYLHRPELTADRFVADESGARWYRSGDRARWLPDGGLEFLGRLDDQVKIRGYRIEPGEIESVLNGHPAVRESVVVATDDRSPLPGGHRQLTAYVVAEPGLSMSDLRGWLSERLPDHLVPAGFVELDRLPLTPNGKVDRAALPAGRPARPDGDGAVAPRTDTERVLAGVWADVLGLDQVGVADNFFALGGDSILAIQVVARAGRSGVSITPAQLFSNQTIAGLAQVATPTGGTATEAEQGEVTGDVPVTPMRAWFHRLALPNADHWNLPVLLVALRPVQPQRLADALAALATHHDLLRSRVAGGAMWILPVAECDPIPVEQFAAEQFAAEQFGELVRQVQGGLDLARGPVLRAAVFTGSGGAPDRVLLVAHHLVVDTVSWHVLLEDLETCYGQLAAGTPVQLPAKTTDVARWARGLTELARSDEIAGQARWWLDRPGPAVPIEGEPGLEGDSDVVVATLDVPATAGLLASANDAYRTRPDELLLAALAVAVTGSAGVPQLLVDVEGHGRDVAVPGVDVSRTVGWFTTLAPVRLDLTGVDVRSPAAVVKAVKEQLRAMPGRGAAYGLARWLRTDDLARQLAELPPAQVSFNYLGRLDRGGPAGAWFAPAPDLVPAARHPAGPRPYPIDVVAGVHDGRLHLYLSHAARERSTVERLAVAYVDALGAILRHCMSPETGGPTPSDFPLAEIGQDQLDRLAAERGCVEDLYPLAPLQHGLLFHTLANPSSGVYFEQFSLRLDGPLDVDTFAGAWRRLLDRHAVLRASVAWQGLAVPHLVVHEQVELPLVRHDWGELPEADQETRLAELLTDDRVLGFDLNRAPLTRLHLVRLGPQRWHLIWSHHHIILDGWSVALLIREVFDTYGAIRTGGFAPAPPPPPYRDLIGYLAGLDHTGAWAYWRRVLSGVTGPTPLGTDSPAVRTGRRDEDYARVHRRLPPERSDAVREFARTHRLTLDTVLHGAWALVLAGRSGTDDVVFGFTASGRPPVLEGVEDMIGLFIATLPARVLVNRDQSVVSWLAGLQRDQVQARQFEHTPLDQIRGWTSIPPDRPLFDSVRALENYPRDSSRFRTAAVAVTALETFEQTDFALSFLVVPDEALLLSLWYDLRRFAPETGEHILRSAEALVLALTADPDRTVGEVLAHLPAPPERHVAIVAEDAGVGPVADLLRGLSLVHDAAVTPTADGRRLIGYLVPDLVAAERGDHDAGGLADQHVADWRAVHDQTFTDARAADPEFDTTGWNSSYTGEPIAADAMAEWRAHTLDRIRALRPARRARGGNGAGPATASGRPTQLLEIGCGAGLQLFGLLDDCDRYVGTDVSSVCLARVRDRLAARGGTSRATVTLLERTADDATGLESGSFDVVVLNSVAQYFPSAAYLDRVLDIAVRLATADGAIFLGDLRHHGLLPAFHVSVQLHRAADLLPAHELQRRVFLALQHERELLVDPEYLLRFAAARPEIGAVELIVKRGRHDTELTRYRYDAVLRLGAPPRGPTGTVWYDWHRDVLSASEIGWLLDQADTDAVGITGVPNLRVAADVEAARLLAMADGGATAGELRLAAGKAAAGMDPERLYRLGEQQGWSVTVSWATNRADGSVNALFRRGSQRAAGPADLHTAGPDEAPSPGQLTNTPLHGRLAESLERQAWQALRQGGPGAARVSRLLVVDDLPRTADGRIDVAGLPVPSDAQDASGAAERGAAPPRTADELRLARIWSQVLRLRSVDVRASFFDLGGDSLLAIRLVDEAARAFDRNVPLAALLLEPTIEGMAAALHAEPRPWTPLVEITRGDGPPFFCVHPVGGNVLCYAELARLVDPHPFCALQARGVEGDDPPYDDLPAMAARYLQDVRRRQPTGPYHLGGWSMGGLVAYEMAEQLLAAGERVGLLVLIDTRTPDLIPAVTEEDELRELRAEAERMGFTPSEVDSAWGRRLLAVYRAHVAAARRYRPDPFAGRTLLLRAADTRVAAPDYGWRGLLSGQWTVDEVPGDHETIVFAPNVQRLAEVLAVQLAAAQRPA